MATVAQALLGLAALRAQQRAQTEQATAEAILAAWGGADVESVAAQWASGLGARIREILTAGQDVASRGVAQYVTDAYVLQGLRVNVPAVNSWAFSGQSSDGRPLDSLLMAAPVRTRIALAQGDSPARAKDVGAVTLRRIVQTEVHDAARAADQVGITAAEPSGVLRSEPVKSGRVQVPDPGKAPPALAEASVPKLRYGWTRMISSDACPRCVVLAGAFYKWNSGFLRHPRCRCTHIPSTEDVAGDVTTNPDSYFWSLTRVQQDRTFGVSAAVAIRDGADLSQVVNATTRRGAVYVAGGRQFTREGVTRRGLAGRRAPGQMRPTPAQIYADAAGSRTAAITMLRSFGYIIQ